GLKPGDGRRLRHREPNTVRYEIGASPNDHHADPDTLLRGAADPLVSLLRQAPWIFHGLPGYGTYAFERFWSVVVGWPVTLGVSVLAFHNFPLASTLLASDFMTRLFGVPVDRSARLADHLAHHLNEGMQRVRNDFVEVVSLPARVRFADAARALLTGSVEGNRRLAVEIGGHLPERAHTGEAPAGAHTGEARPGAPTGEAPTGVHRAEPMTPAGTEPVEVAGDTAKMLVEGIGLRVTDGGVDGDGHRVLTVRKDVGRGQPRDLTVTFGIDRTIATADTIRPHYTDSRTLTLWIGPNWSDPVALPRVVEHALADAIGH